MAQIDQASFSIKTFYGGGFDWDAKIDFQKRLELFSHLGQVRAACLGLLL